MRSASSHSSCASSAVKLWPNVSRGAGEGGASASAMVRAPLTGGFAWTLAGVCFACAVIDGTHGNHSQLAVQYTPTPGARARMPPLASAHLLRGRRALDLPIPASTRPCALVGLDS